ncbi:GNAT family N-acetyltransferase [Kitasatospora sp. NPDC056181]|uniref:GNAT family N-acetyltransferase n=1 Tax=Kitasatospora sp. NPDC056181 TaxID=3345737 RepID=UPI0035D73426
MRIRAATGEDLPLLRELERAAGAPFAAIGMPEIAEDEPPTVEELAHFLDGGTALVALSDEGDEGDSRGGGGGERDSGGDGRAGGEGGTPVGYLLAEPVDGALHIEQVSVHPGHARRGIGRALIEHLAATTDAPALTLTTFADVPWNAPYYARLGFRPLADAEVTPGLREIRRREAGHGLDRWPRLCMRRELGAGWLS